MLHVLSVFLCIGLSLQFNGEYNYGSNRFIDDTKCEPLDTQPANGTWSCGIQRIMGGVPNVIRRICTVQCNDGYFSVDDDMLYCINNSWTRGENRFLFEKNKCDIEDCPQNVSEAVFIPYFGGGMSCVCYPDIEGFNSQETPCADINECYLNNFKCSHICINTPGSAYCKCPSGYNLEEDAKTCTDINECLLENFGCSHTCVNTPGDAFCSCPSGFELKEDTKTCVDIDECAISNETCTQSCINFRGGHRCSCEEGFTLNSDGKSCSPLFCGSISQPPDSIIKCSVDINETDDLSESSSSFPHNTICTFMCTSGYENSTSSPGYICNNGQWIGELPKCILKMPDELSCYQNYTEYLPLGNSSIWLSVPPPPIEEDWEYSIQEPEWMKSDELTEFPVGRTVIKFTAINSNFSGENQTCFITIRVIDSEPPIITGCPESFNEYTDNSNGTLVTWIEPNITDNVGVHQVIKTQEPNTTLVLGSNNIQYIAYDENGNNATCSFTINVTKTACHNPIGPLNGDLSCVHDDNGTICQPICNPGFHRLSNDEGYFYNCTENGDWYPSNIIPDCVDSEPPIIKGCPISFNLTLLNRNETIVQWQEPEITDNVGVYSISKTQVSNSTLAVGVHHVEYTAYDKAGNSARCSFGITIKETTCEDPIGPSNGYAQCKVTYFKGKTCYPSCKPGYRFHPRLWGQLTYVCHGKNNWSPSNKIEDCLEYYPLPSGECSDIYESWTDYEKGEKYCIICLPYMRWSPESRRCKYIRQLQPETETADITTPVVPSTFTTTETHSAAK